MGFTTLSNMGIKVPTRLTQNWDSEMLTTFTKLDAHDHTSTKGVQIPTGGIANDAIDGSKILLANNVGLRQKDVGGTARTLINLDASDVLKLLDALGNEVLQAAATASAVNHFALVNAATGNSPALQATGEADIGLDLKDSNGNELLELVSVASAVNQARITSSATGNTVTIQFAGGDTNGSLSLLGKGTGGLITSTTLRDTNDNEYLEHVATASAVNHIKTTNSATGNDPIIEPDGDDTNRNLDLRGKGTGSLKTPTTLLDANGNEWIEHAATASAVNHIKFTNAATGNPAKMSAVGGDTNINMLFEGKGTGGSILQILRDSWVTNLGISLSSGTFTIEGADGTALSAANPAFVTLQSKASPGKIVGYTVTGNQSFIDDVGSSEIIGNLFGATTGVAWASDCPFYIYAVGNDAETAIAFMISRVPHRKTAPAVGSIGAPDDAVADDEFSFFSLENIDETLFDGNPCVCIGAFRMQMSTSDDWTVQTLSNSDGIGQFHEQTGFAFPIAQNGAIGNGHTKNNSGTSPQWSNQRYTYYLSRFGTCRCRVSMDGDSGVDGSGAVETIIASPAKAEVVSGREIGMGIVNGAGITATSCIYQITTDSTTDIRILDTTATAIQNGDFTNGSRFILGTWEFQYAQS